MLWKPLTLMNYNPPYLFILLGPNIRWVNKIQCSLELQFIVNNMSSLKKCFAFSKWFLLFSSSDWKNLSLCFVPLIIQLPSVDWWFISWFSIVNEVQWLFLHQWKKNRSIPKCLIFYSYIITLFDYKCKQSIFYFPFECFW